ncbi:MAG: hypothetical protein M1839_005980 [Geoglossum umbratile]|nr:MAG: hypothetical protein M1839_005980 [Geoglossum umbratile]
MQAGFQPVERLVRLAPRSIKDKDNAIPWHPAFCDIADQTHTRPAFDQFLKEVIRQAVYFSSRFLLEDRGSAANHSKGWRFKEVRKVDGNDVRIYRRKMKPSHFHVPVTGTNSSASDAFLPPLDPKEVTEHWFARQSIHVNEAAEGTATYREFFNYLKKDHSENEMEMTPNIRWAKQLLEWEGAPDVGFRGETWTDVHMSIYEICHCFPSVVKDRIFPVLIIQAEIGPAEFIVISLPVLDTHLLPGSTIPAHTLHDGAIVAKYVAVERVRVLHARDDDPPDEKSRVEWLMCTSSDAGGWLPLVAQRAKIPGEIAKDVGLFMRWVGKRRAEDGGREEEEEITVTPVGECPRL